MAGAILGVIFFNLPGTVGVVVGIACIIALVSSLTGWSLLYFLLRVVARRRREASQAVERRLGRRDGAHVATAEPAHFRFDQNSLGAVGTLAFLPVGGQVPC